MKIKNAVIVGAGAVGVGYASIIHDTNPDYIKIFADKERIERYSRDGFIVNGKKYEFGYLTPEGVQEPVDLILLSVKFHHLEQTIKDIERLVGPNTIIVSLLNGVSSEEILAQKFGMDKILYGLCISIDAVREGNVITFSKMGRIVFGERDNREYNDKVLAVKEFFDKTNINYEIPDDMIRELWWKYMINIGINQTSAILRAPYRVFQNNDYARDLMVSAMREVIEIAEKENINLTENDINKWLEILDGISPDGKTSMLQDIEAGRKTEVDMFAGDICKLGEKYGVPTPVNKTFLNMIKILEENKG